MTNEQHTTNAVPRGDGEITRLNEGEYSRKGAQVLATTMDPGWTPPSASMNPAASQAPSTGASAAGPSESSGGASTESAPSE